MKVNNNGEVTVSIKIGIELREGDSISFSDLLSLLKDEKRFFVGNVTDVWDDKSLAKALADVAGINVEV